MEIVRSYVQDHLEVIESLPISENPIQINFYQKDLQIRNVLDKKCSFLIFEIPENFDKELALYFSSPEIKGWGIQPVAQQTDLQTFTPCFLRTIGMLPNTTFQLNHQKVTSEKSGFLNQVIFIHDGDCLDETSFLPGKTYFLYFQVADTAKEGDHFQAFVSLSSFENQIEEKKFRQKMLDRGQMKYLKTGR